MNGSSFRRTISFHLSHYREYAVLESLLSPDLRGSHPMLQNFPRMLLFLEWTSGYVVNQRYIYPCPTNSMFMQLSQAPLHLSAIFSLHKSKVISLCAFGICHITIVPLLLFLLPSPRHSRFQRVLKSLLTRLYQHKIIYQHTAGTWRRLLARSSHPLFTAGTEISYVFSDLIHSPVHATWFYLRRPSVKWLNVHMKYFKWRTDQQPKASKLLHIF